MSTLKAVKMSKGGQPSIVTIGGKAVVFGEGGGEDPWDPSGWGDGFWGARFVVPWGSFAHPSGAGPWISPMSISLVGQAYSGETFLVNHDGGYPIWYAGRWSDISQYTPSSPFEFNCAIWEFGDLSGPPAQDAAAAAGVSVSCVVWVQEVGPDMVVYVWATCTGGVFKHRGEFYGGDEIETNMMFDISYPDNNVDYGSNVLPPNLNNVSIGGTVFLNTGGSWSRTSMHGVNWTGGPGDRDWWTDFTGGR